MAALSETQINVQRSREDKNTHVKQPSASYSPSTTGLCVGTTRRAISVGLAHATKRKVQKAVQRRSHNFAARIFSESKAWAVSRSERYTCCDALWTFRKDRAHYGRPRGPA